MFSSLVQRLKKKKNKKIPRLLPLRDRAHDLFVFMQAFGELENFEINWERVTPFYIMEDTLKRAAVIIVLVDASNDFYYQYASQTVQLKYR